MQDFLTPVENTSTYSRTLRTERRLISQQGTTIYGIKLRIVRNNVVTVLVVEVVVCTVGGSVGGFAPGEFITPANAETARVKLRVMIAPVWRNLFTFGAS